MSSYSPGEVILQTVDLFLNSFYTFWFVSCSLSFFLHILFICESSNWNKIKILFFFNETMIPPVNILSWYFNTNPYFELLSWIFLNHILPSGTIYMQPFFSLNKLCFICIPMNKHLLTHSQLLCMAMLSSFIYLPKVWHGNLHVAVTQ